MLSYEVPTHTRSCMLSTLELFRLILSADRGRVFERDVLSSAYSSKDTLTSDDFCKECVRNQGQADCRCIALIASSSHLDSWAEFLVCKEHRRRRPTASSSNRIGILITLFSQDFCPNGAAEYSLRQTDRAMKKGHFRYCFFGCFQLV